MKGLTLWRPWDYAITHLGKRVENRPQPPPRDVLGQQVAIHAGQHWDVGEFTWPKDVVRPDGELKRTLEARAGRIVAVATVVGWYDTQSTKSRTRKLFVLHDDATDLDEQTLYNVGLDRWFLGPVGILLGAVVPLRTPLRCTGKQGWWTVAPVLEAEIIHQVRERAR
jgi:hypothetical protein